MSNELQIILIAATIIFFLIITRLIKKSKLSIELSLVWIVWSLALIVIAFNPNLVYKLTKMLHIMSPMNTLFLIMIFLSYCFIFFLFLRVSILEDKIKNLVQYIALLEKKINDKDDKLSGK